MIALLLACAGAPDLPDLGSLPPFSLTDARGATVTDQDVRGHVVVADFFFTSCPDVCPILSAHMAEVQDHYQGNAQVRLLSISVDPVTDTPDRLSAYAARFHANLDRWWFLTGPADDVKRVVVDGFKIAMQPGDTPGSVLHGERFVVVDPEGRIRAYPDPKEPGKVELYAAVDALL
jgi:protein SCO1/2